MNELIIIIFLLFIHNMHSPNPMDSSKFILNAVKIQTPYRYFVGNSEVILRSTNGGSNWVHHSSGFSGNFNSVFFSSENIGYAVGDSVLLSFNLNIGNHRYL